MFMLHHLSFGVSNIEHSAKFYDQALGVLGYIRVWEDLRPGEADQAVGYGVSGGGDKFTIKLRNAAQIRPCAGFHLAFSAPSRAAVERFHKAALRHGGQDNGAPAWRPDYGPNYYAAFIIDPDGYHIEAVVNEPA